MIHISSNKFIVTDIEKGESTSIYVYFNGWSRFYFNNEDNKVIVKDGIGDLIYELNDEYDEYDKQIKLEGEPFFLNCEEGKLNL